MGYGLKDAKGKRKIERKARFFNFHFPLSTFRFPLSAFRLIPLWAAGTGPGGDEGDADVGTERVEAGVRGREAGIDD